MRKASFAAFAAIAAIALVLTSGATAQAEPGSIKVDNIWRDCHTTSAGVHFRIGWDDVGLTHGKGRYMIKVWIHWQRPNSIGWLTEDTYHAETPWITANKGGRGDIYRSFGDRTVWSGAYGGIWRAKIKIRFVKNKIGPKDHTIGVNDYIFKKPGFKEKTDWCPTTS